MEFIPADWTSGGLRAVGFTGFVTVADLWRDRLKQVPTLPGVYAFLRDSDAEPCFVEPSPAGHFKGRDPTVPFAELEGNWVSGSRVVYVGKAGKPGGKATLRSRLRQYLDMGYGKPAPHWGGRYIWQLADARELLVGWRPMPDESPRDVERELLARFVEEFGRLPFANLAR